MPCNQSSDAMSHQSRPKHSSTHAFTSTGDVQEIELTIAIDKEIVPTLNGQLKLEDILVLHLVDGKDFFVSFLFLTMSRYRSSIMKQSMSEKSLITVSFRSLPLFINLHGL